MVTARFVEGWTSPIEYELKHRNPQTGAEATFNAVGFTADIVIKDKTGTAVVTAGDVEWADAANSKIRYNPDATDLTAALSPYTVHWKVTDVATKVSFYPQEDPLVWIVHPQ